MPRLTLDGLSDNPLERLNDLFDLEIEVLRELHEQYSRAYFDARLSGQLEEAIALNLHGKKKILAMTRHENRQRGSSVRWGDKLDRTSTAYWD